jgi:NADH dehydrogenase
VKASPLARQLADATGGEVDRAGRIAVNPDCTLPGRPDVFAIGDMVSLNNLPGVAQPAIQEGRYVAKLIRARLAGSTAAVRPFTYFDKGTMATIGHNSAVAQAFGRRFTGIVAFVMWAFIHNLYLIGWGNRLGTLYTWLRGLAFARNRAHRLITFEQAHTETTDAAVDGGRPAAPPAHRPDETTGARPAEQPAPRRPRT